MDLRRYLCAFVIFIFTYNVDANAQMSLGIDVGVTNNKLNISSKYSNLKVTSKDGYLINLIIKHKLDKWLTFEASPGVIQKNYTLININNIYQDINNAYLHLPLSIQCEVYLVKNVNISGSFGAYYAYWVRSKISGVAPNVFELSSDSQGNELIQIENVNYNYAFTKQDCRSEFGWIAKLGLGYKISNSISCIINSHYYRGITGQEKKINEVQSQKINKVIALTSGFSYHF